MRQRWRDGTGVLLVDGREVAPVEIAASGPARRHGLLDRDGLAGAILLSPAASVHTIGMRFAIDVAFCDADGVVLRISTLRPWRLSPLVWRSRFVIEAESGAFERWGLQVRDCIEVKE